jgi:hypothetical protein
MSVHFEQIGRALKIRKLCQYNLHQLSRKMKTYRGGSRGNTSNSWMPEDDMFYFITNLFTTLNSTFHIIKHWFIKSGITKIQYINEKSYKKFIKTSFDVGRSSLLKMREVYTRFEYVIKFENLFNKYMKKCIEHIRMKSYTKVLLLRVVPVDIYKIINCYIGIL